MRVALHQHGMVAALEHVTGAAVAPVEGLGVHAIQVAHAAREVGCRRLEHEVIVVAHQAIRVTEPAPPLDRAPQEVEKAATIGGVLIDRRLRVAARGHVVEGTLELEAERSSHGRFVSPSMHECKT